MGAGGEGTDNTFTEIRYGRCERNTVEGESRGGCTTRNQGGACIEERPGDILAGDHRVRRISGELGDREDRARVAVDDGRRGGGKKCKKEKHSSKGLDLGGGRLGSSLRDLAG